MTDPVTVTALVAGTWIRSRVAASDSGPYGDRHAPVGSLARIEGPARRGTAQAYAVRFWPSRVENAWLPEEIARDAEVLAPGDPAIPDEAGLALARAVGAIADGDGVDPFGAGVDVTASEADAVHAAAGDRLEAVRGILPGAGSLEAEAFNRLAALAGIADRAPTRDPFAPGLR